MAMSLAPGLRFERLDASAPPVLPIRLDVAGFVGIAARGPLDVPVPVQSWRQFETRFGGFTGAGFLAYAVRGFFENGGRRCWVIRVASRDPLAGATAASLTVPLVSGGSGVGAWRIRASSPGAWGNALAVTLREVRGGQTLSDPARSDAEAAAVLGIDGFERYSAVRISQQGAPPAYKVVSAIDPIGERLLWVHPDPAARTRHDAPLAGLDLTRPLLIESVEYTLLVYEAGRFLGAYPRLSAVPEHPRYGPHLLGPEGTPPGEPVHASAPQPRPSSLPAATTLGSVPLGGLQAAGGIPRPADLGHLLPRSPEPVVIEELHPQPLLSFVPLDVGDQTPRLLSGGGDGLALLRPEDFSGSPLLVVGAEGAALVQARGFRALDTVAEVTTIAMPDLHIRPVPLSPRAPPPPCVSDPCLPETAAPPVAPPPALEREEPPIFSLDRVARVQAELVEHCEARTDRIALLDPPWETAIDAQEGPAVLRAWRQRFSSSYAAVYWPWVRVADPLRPGMVRDLPPSGHAAGLFARAETSEGVHRAPANFSLGWVQGLTLPADEVLHGDLNTIGINVIRALPGRGIRILGARTFGADGSVRFLNVRRLLIMLRKALDRSTQWAAFEPNDYRTRSKLRLVASSFLFSLWQRGALAGEVADAAFRVKCDEENNPPVERDNGRLLIEIAIAPTHPFEFILIRVGRTESEFEIVETSALRGA